MSIRISSIQYPLTQLSQFADFYNKVEHYIRTAHIYKSDFAMFPEYFTTELLTIEKASTNINFLPSYTERIQKMFIYLAKKYNMHIIAGTHVYRKENKLLNMSSFYFPDGRIVEQPKLHLTPLEKSMWNLSEGNNLNIIETNKGKCAILTCYDIEFPEVARIARQRGADFIFCPSNTDNIHSYNRVRQCCHARTVENQIYVILGGTVGELPNIEYMGATFARSAILTPSDLSFPQNGIISEGETNIGMVVTGDIDLNLLYEIRENGSVTTWQDRRLDLYKKLDDTIKI